MRKYVVGKRLAGAVLLVVSGVLSVLVSASAGLADGANPLAGSMLAEFGSAPWLSRPEQIEPQSTPSPAAATGGAQAVPAEPVSERGFTLVALVTVNVRTGPGLNFPIVGVLEAGSEAQIISLSTDRLWWHIECPLTIIAPECWITADPLYVRISGATSVAFALLTPTMTPEPGGGNATTTSTPEVTQGPPDPTLTATPTSIVAFTPTPEPTLTATTTEVPFTVTPTSTRALTFTPAPTFTPTPTFTATPTFTPPVYGIVVEKSTNGQDADAPPGPEIPVGAAVVWQYNVRNIGISVLSNIAVGDDQGVTVSCPQSELRPFETMTCTASGTATLGQYRNIGTVTADAPGGVRISATDASHYVGVTAILSSAQSGCTIAADPVKLSEGQETALEIHAPDAVSLILHSVGGILAEFSPLPEVLEYSFVPHEALFGSKGEAVITATGTRADGTVLTCAVVLLREASHNRSVSVIAAHGEPGYTAEQVMTSYGLDYIPPYVVTEGYQTLQVHVAEMARNQDRSVKLLGGRHLVSLPFQVNADGSVDNINFTVPHGQIILLQVGDSQGRHFDTSRYIPVPYVVNNGDVNVQAFRDPGGIWHFNMEGNFDLVRSQDLVFMSEVASQHLARNVGGTVMENNIGRALARQQKFGLWQLPGSEYPDSPWASQFMAAQCGQVMVYDRNVVPAFIRVTGTNQYTDLRTEEEFWNSLRSFPSPPNGEDKFGAWYCDEVEQAWQPPGTAE